MLEFTINMQWWLFSIILIFNWFQLFTFEFPPKKLQDKVRSGNNGPFKRGYRCSGPCKVRNETQRNETKSVNWETKRNRICKLRNETKRDHLIYVRVYLRNYFVFGKSRVHSQIKNKHRPIPYKCIINQFNVIMIDGGTYKVRNETKSTKWNETNEIDWHEEKWKEKNKTQNEIKK